MLAIESDQRTLSRYSIDARNNTMMNNDYEEHSGHHFQNAWMPSYLIIDLFTVKATHRSTFELMRERQPIWYISRHSITSALTVIRFFYRLFYKQRSRASSALFHGNWRRTAVAQLTTFVSDWQLDCVVEIDESNCVEW